MVLPAPLRTVVAFLRPDVALVCLAVVAYGALESRYGGVISEIGGLGGDGTIHVTLAGRLVEAVRNQDATVYEYRHILPYLTVREGFRLLGLEYDAVLGRPAIIAGHRVQNVLCLLVAIFLWGRTLEHWRVSTATRWLSFPLLLLSFAFTKMPFYHPCNGDSAQFLLGVAMLHSVVRQRTWLLLILALLAFYIRPGADIYAACLVAFRPGPLQPEGLERRTWLGTFAAGGVTLLTVLIALAYFADPSQVRTIQPPLEFLRGISIVLMFATVLGAFLPLWSGLEWRQVLRIRLVPLLLFAAMNLTARYVTAAIAKPVGDITNEFHILADCVAYAVNRPAAAPLAHVIYFGPLALLTMLLWARVAALAQRAGLPLLAAISVATLLGLHSESRLLTTAFPMFAALTCLALDRIPWNATFAGLCLAAGLLLSKVWLSLGTPVPWNAAASPDMLYWINQGPWIPLSMYIVQGAVVVLLAFALHRQLRALDRVASSSPTWLERQHRRLTAWFAQWPRPMVGDRAAWLGLAGGWALIALATSAVLPRMFAGPRRAASEVTALASPPIVRTGSTTLTATIRALGSPSRPDAVEYEWEPFPPERAALVTLSNPRGSQTRARFAQPGTYTINVTARDHVRQNVSRAYVQVFVQSLNLRKLCDFNGDLVEDVVWYNPASGELSIDLMNGAEGPETSAVVTEPNREWQPIRLGDFTGDRRPDILWQDTIRGTLVLHLMDGTNVSQKCILPGRDPPWGFLACGDLDGDGRCDLVWRDGHSGALLAYFMYGGTILRTGELGTVPHADAHLLDIGDFTGDGGDDLLWIAPDGALHLSGWQDNAPHARRLVRNADVLWQPIGFADFDGDRRRDILWQHKQERAAYLQFARDDGPAKLRKPLIRVVPGVCELVGLCDLNGDGATDVLWQDQSNGELLAHLGSCEAVALGALTPVQRGNGLNRSVAALGDYDGDGCDDVLMRDRISGELFLRLQGDHSAAAIGGILPPRGPQCELLTLDTRFLPSWTTSPNRRVAEVPSGPPQRRP